MEWEEEGAKKNTGEQTGRKGVVWGRDSRERDHGEEAADANGGGGKAKGGTTAKDWKNQQKLKAGGEGKNLS
jgi:hypothetical protein